MDSHEAVPQDLTAAQWSAIQHIEGPLQVLAGPGSGKTRVITRRVAHLIESGVRPQQVLAITFTNKAAREMQARIQSLIPGQRVWVSTFHRFCSLLLRRYGHIVGLQPNFSILDTGDQRRLIRDVLNQLDVDAVHFSPPRVLARISRAKNDLLSPTRFAEAYGASIGNHYEAVVSRVYPNYQKRLLAANCVDFDDLLLHVVTILRESEELRADLDRHYQFVLVDEYQDTNLAQYQIVRALSIDYPNLCVTGDPDQSIYGWRGAQIENILRFDQDYPAASIVRLEENFRSSGNILRVADQLIAHNKDRKPKALIATEDDGLPVQLLCFSNGRAEADAIARDIWRQVEDGARDWADFAIFYRVNAMSRQLELAMSRHRVPAQVAAGLAFYERAEIKDLVCYLRLVNNPDDESAFLRVVNSPTRGVGKTSLNRLTAWASEQGRSLLQAALVADQVPRMTKRAATALREFAEVITELAESEPGAVEGLLARVIDRTRYSLGLVESQDEQDLQRLANINELLASAHMFDEAADNPNLEEFLETCSLAGDVDVIDEEVGKVTLMTLHAAKGLEFPVVYIVGVEQNLIPHERALREGTRQELEEERRLLFVGITRAEEELFLTQVGQRDAHGRRLHTIPSDFLSEMVLTIADRYDDFPSSSFEVYDEPTDDAAFDFPGAGRKRRDVAGKLSTTPQLMRGSDLLGEPNSPNSVDLPVGFAVGMLVRHPKYGRGTVTSTGGMSKHRTVTVSFDQGGREETFVAAKCPLQPIGTR